jgi:hypothetical protein
MKKTILSYVITIAAGVVSFMLAMSLRLAVLLFARLEAAGKVPWSLSLINAVTIILLMIIWLAYIFYTQHYFEKKVGETKKAYVKGLSIFVLPPAVLLIAVESALRIYESM